MVLVAHALFHDAAQALKLHRVKGQRNICACAGRGPGNEASIGLGLGHSYAHSAHAQN